jgi:hypothetical protein
MTKGFQTKKMACSLVLIASTGVFLASCGGAGSSSKTITGVAATGAPLGAATIEVYDASGTKVATATTDGSGKYQTTPFTATGPYILKATAGSTVLYSVQVATDGTPVNITPLSNLVTTLLSPTGNAERIVSEFAANNSIVQNSKVDDKKAFVKALIDPVATAVNLPRNIDVINTSMVANGTGIDQVLDNVSVSVSHDTNTSTIQIVYKKAGPGEYEPQIITFSSSDSSSNIISSVNGVTYTSNDVYDPKMTSKIWDWVKKTNDCHKIPADKRWTGQSGSKIFTKEGDVCNRIFYNNNPALFRDFGATAEEIFTGNYSSKTWTTDVVTEPQYVYTTATGEVMVKAKATVIRDDESTYERFYFFNLTPDPNNNNELRSLGNRYDYEVMVFPRNAVHYFPYSPDYKFTYSGFQIDIPTSATRGSDTIPSRTYSKRIKRAEVRFPNGDVMHMYDLGREQLTACISRPADDNDARTKCSVSGFKVVRSDFYQTPADPRNLGRTRPAQYAYTGFVDYGSLSDIDVKKLPMMGTFQVTLTLSDGTIVPMQRVPFFGRPKTHSEIKAAVMAEIIPSFTEKFVSSLYRSTDSNCNFDQFKSVFALKKGSENNCASGDADFSASWTGMAQWIYMNGIVFDINNPGSTSPTFEQSKSVASSDRDKIISCSKYGLTNACATNSTKFYSWFNSSYIAIFNYFEIGNYYSDFGTNISAYGFYAIESSEKSIAAQ